MRVAVARRVRRDPRCPATFGRAAPQILPPFENHLFPIRRNAGPARHQHLARGGGPRGLRRLERTSQPSGRSDEKKDGNPMHRLQSIRGSVEFHTLHVSGNQSIFPPVNPFQHPPYQPGGDGGPTGRISRRRRSMNDFGPDVEPWNPAFAGISSGHPAIAGFPGARGCGGSCGRPHSAAVRSRSSSGLPRRNPVASILPACGDTSAPADGRPRCGRCS